MPTPDLSNWSAAYECLQLLEQGRKPGSIYDVLVVDPDARYGAWNLAALTPWAQLPEDKPAKKGKPPTPWATQAIREGIRAPNKLCNLAEGAHRHRSEIQELKKIVCEEQPTMKERDRFGMAIRGWDSKGGQWRLQVLYAVLVDAEMRTGGGNEAVETVLAEWQRFVDHLIKLDVIDAPALKYIANGKVLAEELGLKSGPWMAPALNMVLAWQFRNPDVTDPTGAVEEVKRRKGELGIK